MDKYGLTEKGPNIKRLDVIVDEMHTDLTEKFGVNTRQNPQSFLSHFVLNIADKIAELWEFGEDVYFSMYPSTAEGISLDNAAQFGGTTRETAAKSFYPIHCTGKDGTVLATGTLIASNTNPPTHLSIQEDKEITRGSFNKAKVKIVKVNIGDTYTVAINGEVYSYVATEDNVLHILNGLADKISKDRFDVSVDEEKGFLLLDCLDVSANNTLVLSENFTTETVTTVITFGTNDTGDIFIPDGAITKIVKADAGLLAVKNMCGYIAGRDEEDDVGFRASYADKIFNRSSMMLESIKSAIIENVQGVKSVAPYENDTNEVDGYGRPPHSIEFVVDGGDSAQIAKQILKNKAGGIYTVGTEEVILEGVNGEAITIRFNRPSFVYTWVKLTLTLKPNEELPINFAELLKNVVLENIGVLEAGKDVVPQEFMSELYKVCSGISYIDMALFTTTDPQTLPDNYNERSATISAREKAYTTADMIEVVINE